MGEHLRCDEALKVGCSQLADELGGLPFRWLQQQPDGYRKRLKGQSKGVTTGSQLSPAQTELARFAGEISLPKPPFAAMGIMKFSKTFKAHEWASATFNSLIDLTSGSGARHTL